MPGLYQWLLATWYGATRRGAWLLPLAWLFALLAWLRRGLYRRGLLSAYRSTRPVVIVGNVTVGGTGKTPLVIWLTERLTGDGRRVGVASRGHGRRDTAARRVCAGDAVADVGDEPLLIARRTGAAVAVGADRAAAVRLLEGDCDLILCDDGLQHYALERDAEVAVVDGARGLGNGWLLPAGPLRESPSRLAAADAIVVNGAGFGMTGSLRMDIEPTRFVGVASGEGRDLADFRGQRAHAVAAIGNPGRFFGMLGRLGIDVDAHPLPDHATPGERQLRFADGAAVLMTEKDAVKCPDGGLHHAWYVEVDAHIEDAAAAALIERIVRLARERNLGA